MQIIKVAISLKEMNFDICIAIQLKWVGREEVMMITFIRSNYLLILFEGHNLLYS